MGQPAILSLKRKNILLYIDRPRRERSRYSEENLNEGEKKNLNEGEKKNLEIDNFY